jgi:transposase
MFVHAFPNMGQKMWLEGHMLAFEAFGGVPAIITPDCSAEMITPQVTQITL